MNGIHDMGGMDGFGPIPIEKDEPVFHAEWERRMYGIAMGLVRNADEFRHAIERIPARVYLDSTYYERWLNATMTLLVERKQVTREELVSRGAAPVAPAQPANQFKETRRRCDAADRVFAKAIGSSRATSILPVTPGSRAMCAASAA